ncbi:MAG: WhiB family transcriptional regulator [Armatimonadia bacterium]
MMLLDALDFEGVTLPWRQWAACRGRDTRLFFPDRGGSTMPARAICGYCTVQPDCLEYAVRTKQQCGVWGGSDYRERQDLRAGRLSLADISQRMRQAVHSGR